METKMISMVAEAWNMKELGETLNKINSSDKKKLEKIEISESGNHAFIYYMQEWMVDEEGRLMRIK